jgi:hypothetical protein
VTRAIVREVLGGPPGHRATIAIEHGDVDLNQIDTAAECRLRRLQVLRAHDDAQSEQDSRA